MKTQFLFCLAFILLFLQGCAMGPLTNGYTARPLGKGEFSADLMATGYRATKDSSIAFVPSVRATMGITDSLDLSFHTELKTYGLMAKYSVLNSANADGLSLALMTSIYGVGQQSSFSVGGIASYLIASRWEPYFIARYNQVRIDPADFDAKYFPVPSSGNFGFFYGTLGAKYWLRKDTAIGTEISAAPGLKYLDPSEFMVVHATFLF